MDTMIKLKLSNYLLWKTKMLDLLYSEDLHKPIVNKGEMPDGADEDEWKLMNRRATAFIRLCVDESLIYYVYEETDAYSIWKKLEDVCVPKGTWSKFSEFRKLMNLKYKDGHNIGNYLNKFQGVLNQLEAMELPMDDEVKAMILLSSLPPSLLDPVTRLCDPVYDGRKLTLEAVMHNILKETKCSKPRKTSVWLIGSDFS